MNTGREGLVGTSSPVLAHLPVLCGLTALTDLSIGSVPMVTVTEWGSSRSPCHQLHLMPGTMFLQGFFLCSFSLKNVIAHFFIYLSFLSDEGSRSPGDLLSGDCHPEVGPPA